MQWNHGTSFYLLTNWNLEGDDIQHKGKGWWILFWRWNWKKNLQLAQESWRATEHFRLFLKGIFMAFASGSVWLVHSWLVKTSDRSSVFEHILIYNIWMSRRARDQASKRASERASDQVNIFAEKNIQSLLIFAILKSLLGKYHKNAVIFRGNKQFASERASKRANKWAYGQANKYKGIE